MIKLRKAILEILKGKHVLESLGIDGKEH